MSRLITLLLVGVLFLGVAAMPASAVGTSADTGAITNGFFATGDTVPKTFGRVSVAMMKTVTNSDSRYQGPSAADTVLVDTGYDLRNIDATAQKSSTAGDTLLFIYRIENLGNATYRIDLDTFFVTNNASTGDTNWGAKYYTIFYDLGNDSALATDSRNLTNLTLPPGAFRQVIVTVAIPDTASDGDSTHITLQVTDNAPNVGGSTTGDLWETGLPLPGAQTNDARDTQQDTVIVQVSGPNVFVLKTCTEVTAGRSRPGDTLMCKIVFDNDGNTEAHGVYIFDGVPQWTRYQKNTADSSIYAGNAAAVGDTDIAVAFDTDAVGADLDFKDTEGNQSDTLTSGLVTIIRWQLKFGLADNATGGSDAVGTVNFNDGSATMDNGLVTYRVVIE